MIEELKPCPFCGSIESLDKKHVVLHNRYCADDEMWSIECRNCLISTQNFDTEYDLLKFWNTRPAEDVLKAKGVEI